MESEESTKKARSKRKLSLAARMRGARGTKKRKSDENPVLNSSDSEDDVVLSKLTQVNGASTSTNTTSSRKLSHVSKCDHKR